MKPLQSSALPTELSRDVPILMKTKIIYIYLVESVFCIYFFIYHINNVVIYHKNFLAVNNYLLIGWKRSVVSNGKFGKNEWPPLDQITILLQVLVFSKKYRVMDLKCLASSIQRLEYWNNLGSSKSRSRTQGTLPSILQKIFRTLLLMIVIYQIIIS